jgi:hypothetical protein
MGGAKRMMERHETICGVARGIALEAGTLRRCEYHEDCIFEGANDAEGAYKLGNYKFSAGSLKGVFESRREMTDCIKEVVEEVWGDECPRCAELRDE